MARIISVEHMDNKGSHAIVYVTTDDGTEAEVWVGGDCELFFDEKHNKVKAFIKKKKSTLK